MVAKRSRADYFKERRKTVGQFNVSLPKEKLSQLYEILEKRGQTKTDWLNQKIDEEISQNK